MSSWIKPSKQAKPSKASKVPRKEGMSKASKPAEETKSNNKAKLTSLVAKLNKTFGNNAVILGVSEKEESYKHEFIPTGILQLDTDLGGGIAVGRYTEISGKESSTKTTLSLHVLANAQKMGYICALIDVEGTSGDKDYLEACGVDVDSLLYVRPTSLEEVGGIIDTLQTEGVCKFAVYDSIAMSMATKTELDTQFGDSYRMGIPQSELGSIFRRFQMANNRYFRTGETPFTLIAINQLRERIGGYGDSSYTPGGKAKDFMSSCNIRLRQGDWIKEGQNVVGQVVKYKVTKNKLYKRNRAGEVDFYFDDNSAGVEKLNYDVLKDTVIVALGMNVIVRAGAWFSYKDKFKLQGVNSVVEELRNNEALLKEIQQEVMKIVKKTHEGKE